MLAPGVPAGTPAYSRPTMEAAASNRVAIPERPAPTRLRSLPRRAWLALSAAWAVLLGLLPHILHHIGPLAGAALFAGVGGSLLFGAAGLLAAIPFLLRLHRRYGNWRVPAATLALFAAIFSISTFVIGPTISGGGGADASATSSQPANPPVDNKEPGHAAHH